jgi:hypothetical protein
MSAQGRRSAVVAAIGAAAVLSGCATTAVPATQPVDAPGRVPSDASTDYTGDWKDSLEVPASTGTGDWKDTIE